MTIGSRSLTIRVVEEHDLEPLARWLTLGLDHIDARWAERLAGLQTMFVAELDGRLAGSVSFDVRGEFADMLHLFALGVVPSLQQRGIGKALIRRVEDEARARGLRGVWLGVADDNYDARRLYDRLGYVQEGEAYTGRWLWRGPDGEEREVVENIHRMFKRFGPSTPLRTGPPASLSPGAGS